MKKFFALLVLGFMLALAGTAFATDGGHVTPTPTPEADTSTGLSNETLEELGWTEATEDQVVRDYQHQATAQKKSSIENIFSSESGEMTSLVNLPGMKANALKGGQKIPMKIKAGSFGSDTAGNFWLSIIRRGISFAMSMAGVLRPSNTDASLCPFDGFDVTDANGRSILGNDGIGVAADIDPNKDYFVVLEVKENVVVASDDDTLDIAVVTVDTSSTPRPYRRGGGGGCSAGWSALAIAMLSGLALVSKKK